MYADYKYLNFDLGNIYEGDSESNTFYLFISTEAASLSHNISV